MTDHDAPWRVIHRDLLRRIEAGELKPGEQLPSTPHLQTQYGHLSPTGVLSRAPVQRAVQMLREQGHLVFWPGLGVYVADRR